MSPICQLIQMKKSFKAAFYLERKREWEDSNELEAHKRSFRYLCSDNNAAAGNFLEATYVPKKNDLWERKVEGWSQTPPQI